MGPLTPSQIAQLKTELIAVRSVYKRLMEQIKNEPIEEGHFLKIRLMEDGPLRQLGYLGPNIELTTEEDQKAFEIRAKN